jgi:hypothetical protein
MRQRIFWIASLLLTGALLHAQDTRSTLFGHVIDPSSAAVVGAKVTITNLGTNVSTVETTNESGYFEAALLVAGNYRLVVEVSGFKTSVREPIALPVGSRLQVNFNLELGAIVETVSVTAAAPLLDTNTLSSGRVVESRSILGLSVPGGNSMMLAKLAPGVQSFDSLSDKTVRLHSNGAGSRYYTAGNVGGNEWSIDGTPNNANSRGVAFMPAPELVQEFKLETSSFDASFGHSTGVNIQVMTRAGTNDFHGTVRETHHQMRWDALDFFTKQSHFTQISAAVAAGKTDLANQLRAQPGQVPGRENTFAATIGGPVRLPKIYNGKNRLFFFFGYAGFRVGQYRQTYNAVPTDAMRQGDFSQLLRINATQYQIYDPLTVRADTSRSGHVVRDPFPGNIVPQTRIINPMYKFYSSLLPSPNTLSSDPAVEPNRDYTAYSAPYQENYNAYSNRYDYNLSEKNRFYLRWSWNKWVNGSTYWLYASNIPDIGLANSIRQNFGAGADWVHTFSSKTLLDVAVSSNVYKNQNIDPGFQKYKPSSVGLPAYVDVQASSALMLPNVSWSGWSGVTQSLSTSVTRYRALSGKADLSHLTSTHTLRAGFDVRGQFFTGFTPGNNAGNFSFTSTYTQRTDDGYQSAGTGSYGGPWAAFMMGLPGTASIDANASSALLNPYLGAYIQDNWRVSQKLSLNFGLRMEYEWGPTERYNRMIADFDPTAKLPISDAAQAAYAKTPVPELAASQFMVLGGSLYPATGSRDRRLWNSAMNWMPRVAAAYQLTPKTVLRAGYGLFYDTLNVLNESVNQLGFSRTTSTTFSTDFGQHWLVGNPAAGISPLTDPFPVRADGTRFDAPLGSAMGLMAAVGRGVTFIPYDRKHARQNRWRLDVQRQVGSNMALNVGYAGSYSDHIGINQVQSYLPAQYWSFGTTRNDAVANNMNANVTNPFYIGNFSSLQASNPVLYQYMSTSSFFTSQTIRKYLLLEPFPQMNGLTKNVPLAKAKTEELDVSFERRFSKGFNLNVAYTRLYNYAADYFPNQFDASPAWRPSNQGTPHRFTGTGIYQLPLGKGKRWLNKGPASVVLGGYQFTGVYELAAGQLLTWSSTIYYNGNPSNVCGGPHTLAAWFNTDNFQRNPSLTAASFQAAVFPTMINGYGGCRIDKLNNWNLNAERSFKMRERAELQFRFDVFNLQNRSQFTGPNTTPTSTDFGKVTGQPALTGSGGGAINRWIQMQLRLSF